MNFLVILFLLIQFTFAGDIFIANLKGDMKDLGNTSCWSDDGKFLDQVCEKSIFKCEYAGEGTSFNLVKVKLLVSSQFINENGGMSLSQSYAVHIDGTKLDSFYEHFANYPEIPLIGHKYPVGSKVTIYSLKSESTKLTLDVIKQFVVPQDGIVKVEQKETPIHRVKISLPDLGPNMNLSLRVLSSFHSSQIPNQKEIEVYLPSGEFPISVMTMNSSGEYLQTSFKLSIKKSEIALNKHIVIKSEQLVKTSQHRLTDKISWYPESEGKTELKISLTYSSDGYEGTHFESIENFFISKLPEENFSSYFKVVKGVLEMPPEKQEEFKAKINLFPTYSMRVSGSCIKTKKLPQSKSIAVHKAPSESSETYGDIIVHLGPESGSISTHFEKKDGKVSEFRVNLTEGSCRNESVPELLHAVREVKDGWVNLGKGPWGKSGWTKSSYNSISAMGEYFSFKSISWATISHVEKNTFRITGKDFSRAEKEIEDAGYNGPEIMVDEKIDSSKFWSKDGRFIPTQECSYGC